MKPHITMKLIPTVFGLASVASAHTLFTTLFINGKNQGDGTCIRMPQDGATANGPIEPVTGEDMACGRLTALPILSSFQIPKANTSSRARWRSARCIHLRSAASSNP